MKKTICTLVAFTLLASTVPAAAATGESATPAKKSSLHDAIGRAAASAVLEPGPATLDHASATARAQVPHTMPRKGSSQVRHQGHGSTGMIIGLVSTVIGVAATVYAVKEMKKTTDQQKQ
jgi:hypothetical protein